MGFAGRARRNARPAVFPAPTAPIPLRPCARRIPISAKQTRAARFSQHAISATCPPKEETNFHREGRARPGSPLRDREVAIPFHHIHRAISQSLLCSPFGQIRPPRKDSTNERLAFHKAKPRGATLVSGHGRLLNRGPRTIFDGGRRSKESVSGGR